MSSNFTLMLCGGAIFGAWAVSFLANKFGRKYTMIFFDILLIFGCSLLNINNYPVLLIGRFITGVAKGGENIYFSNIYFFLFNLLGNIAIIPLYVNEITPNYIKGKTVNLKKKN